MLVAELGRARQFELVSVSADVLRLLTGRNSWSGEEKLPLDFFDKLKEKLGVDAVLMNTAIAGARDVVMMAGAMRRAVEAGRMAFLAGRIARKRYASASSPVEGLIASETS